MPYSALIGEDGGYRSLKLKNLVLKITFWAVFLPAQTTVSTYQAEIWHDACATLGVG